MRKATSNFVRFWINIWLWFKAYPKDQSLWGFNSLGTYMIHKGHFRYTSLHWGQKKAIPEMTYEQNIYHLIGKNLGMFEKAQKQLKKEQEEQEEWSENE